MSVTLSEECRACGTKNETGILQPSQVTGDVSRTFKKFCTEQSFRGDVFNSRNINHLPDLVKYEQ